jgi:hypothetical protein
MITLSNINNTMIIVLLMYMPILTMVKEKHIEQVAYQRHCNDGSYISFILLKIKYLP